jgi:hypothetical protein
VAPVVSSVSPAAGASGVAAGVSVSAVFSEAMDAASVSSSSFTLTGPSGSVSAVVSYDAGSRTAVLDPVGDLAAGTWTARVRGGVGGVADLAGNVMEQDRVWSFEVASSGGGGGGSQVVTVPVGEDTYVLGSSPGANFGSDVLLAVDASPVSVSYLKFDLGALAGRSVTAASLVVQATTSGSTGTQSVRMVADDGWSEATMTYANRPAVGSVVGTLGPTARNTSYTVPLSVAAVQGELGSTLSLGLDSTSSDGLDLGSGETSTPPRLVLTLSGTG